MLIVTKVCFVCTSLMQGMFRLHHVGLAAGRRLARAGRDALCCSGLFALLATGFGCSAAKSTFQIEDRSTNVQPRVFETEFDESYFDFDRQGNIEIVMRREDSGVPGGRVAHTEQVLLLRSVWQPIPGHTFAESSQINGMVTYAILSGRTGATYEGAGSIFFHHHAASDTLSGTLELAALKPRRQRTPDSVLFEQVVVSGKFHAKRDRRQVVRAANNMARIFGPLPPPMAMDGEK